MVKGVKKAAERVYMVLILMLLYIPIAILIVSSFNASEKNKAVWGGFTLRAYKDLIGDETVMGALYNTLLLAGGASLIATVLGTLVCIGMINMRKTFKVTYNGSYTDSIAQL